MKLCTLCGFKSECPRCKHVDENLNTCDGFILSDKALKQHDKRIIDNWIKLRNKAKRRVEE